MRTEDRSRVVAAVRSLSGNCIHRAIVGRAVLLALMGIESEIIFGTAVISPSVGRSFENLKPHAWNECDGNDGRIVIDFSSGDWQSMAGEAWDVPPPACLWGPRHLLVDCWRPAPAVPEASAWSGLALRPMALCCRTSRSCERGE